MVYFDEVAFRVALARRRIRYVAELARTIGMSRAYLAMIVKGAVPSAETQGLIAKALGVAVSDLWKPQPGVGA